MAVGPKGGFYLYEPASGRLGYFNPTDKTARANGVEARPKSLAVIRPKGAPQDRIAPQSAQSSQYPQTGAIAADPAGDVFVTDAENERVSEIDAYGKLAILAGKGAPSPRDRCCSGPAGLAVDAAGNVYVTDSGEAKVWFINRSRRTISIQGRAVAAGTVEALAGNGRRALGGEGVRATETSLFDPRGIALDGRGSLYLAEGLGHSVRKIDPGGLLTTVAGTGQAGFNGDGLRRELTALTSPSDVTVDGCGNLLVSDRGNDRIRRVNLAGACGPKAYLSPSSPRSAETKRTAIFLVLGAVVAVAGVISGLAIYRSRTKLQG